jgi:hypothetical protein
MSSGGTGGNEFTTITCYAVYPTASPYKEMPLDTVSFNLTQVSSSDYNFEVASVNVSTGVSSPTMVNWSFNGGKSQVGKIGEIVQENYTGPQTNFSVSVSFMISSENNPREILTQGWSLTNNFTIFLFLPQITYPPPNPVVSNGILWDATTTYPQNFADGSCVTNSGYVYCVTGDDYSNAVYYAKISASGLALWQITTPYPLNETHIQCVTYSSFVYCIGSDSNATYYAQISSSGVGSWIETTSYPMNCSGGCFVGAGTSISDYVFCMSGAVNQQAVYFTNMTSGGLGQWQRSAYDYPVAIAYNMACTSGGSRIYCIGGYPFTNEVYYTTFSNGQIGPWSRGPAYPWAVASAACAYYAGVIECVGGQNASGYSLNQVYYSSVNSSGLGNWSDGSDYPSSVSDQTCFAGSDEIFCVGGLDFSPGLSFLDEVSYSLFPSG